MSIQMTILGLGQIGASIGLALQPHKEQIERTGNDRDMSELKKAVKLGVVDKTIHNMEASVKDADIVVIALPLDEVRRAFEIIAPALKAGAVVIDTSSNKIAIAKWARELLPAERYYVTMTPSLNPNYLHSTDDGLESAHADLFKNSLMIISSPPESHPDALKLASDITVLLGARPYFADPYEVDGLLAASDVLPKVVAAALLHATTRQPSWREGRKLAGRIFVEGTEPITQLGEKSQLGQAALLNPENTVRTIDDMIEALQEARDLIASQNVDGLHDYMEEALESREKWLKQRQEGSWDMAMEKMEMPGTGEIFGRLFGMRSRKNKDKDKK